MTPRETLNRYLDALLEGDVETVRSCFAPDATWWIHGDLPVAKTYRGPGAIVDELLFTVGERFDAATRRSSSARC